MKLSPQHANYSACSAGERIKKSPRWDNDEGVAATVGTIMSLLVFITFFGIFVNQFIPVWMEDNESGHMTSVIEQFSSLKSSIDIGITNAASSKIIAPTPIFIPITLSAPGIPVFAAPTAGILYYGSQGLDTVPTFYINYTYYSGDHEYELGPENDGRAGGYLELYCPNRYYVEQSVIYENGAIILNQTDGEVILAGPQFTVKNLGTTSNPNRVMMMTQLTLLGNDVTVGGTGTKGVSAVLDFADTKALENSGPNSDVVIQISSRHGYAWYNYFLTMLNGTAGMTLGSEFDMTTPVFHEVTSNSTRDDYYTFTLTVYDINVLDYTKAIATLKVGELGV